MRDYIQDHYWVFAAAGVEKLVVRAPKDVARDAVDRIRASGYPDHPWDESLLDNVVDLPNLGELTRAARIAHGARSRELEQAVEQEVSASVEHEWVREYAASRVAQDPVARTLHDLQQYGHEVAGRERVIVQFEM